MKSAPWLIMLLLPALVQAETLYKCKATEGGSAYSEYPCRNQSSQKIILKDNTLDHSEMRSSKLYKKPLVIDQSGPSVTSIPEIKGAGFREFPPSNTGSSYTNFR